MSQLIRRSYKFRAYPTTSQREQLRHMFGCARFVWNHSLALRDDVYKHTGASMNSTSLSKHLTHMKRCGDYDWLNQCPVAGMQQTLRDQDSAFKNFFEGRAKYPRFKKLANRQSIRLTLDHRYISHNYRAGMLLRLTKLGEIKLRWSRIPKGIPKMATIKLDSDGRYYVSFSCEEPRPEAKAKQGVVGVDVGIKDVVVTSDGYKSGAPKFTYRYARELKLAQRKLSRKTKGSGRWKRQRVKVARIHSKIARCRADFLHNQSAKLVRENAVICIEDLNVAGMVKNRKLSKAVSDSSMSELHRQIEYKAAWYGSTVLKVDRWFPSTKMCSGCGVVHDIPLSKRTMDCECGVTLDRDENAARNIKAECVRSLNVELDINYRPEYAA